MSARLAGLATFGLAILLSSASVDAQDSAKRRKPEQRKPASDTALAALEKRGADRRGMGVDQATSVHRFDALHDGGRIELQRAVDDSAGVAQVRSHLRDIAASFKAGDFKTPGFVHDKPVPGVAVMAAKRAVIQYAVNDLPRGAEVRITTHDHDAIDAIHAFMAFQRREHHAGGMDGSHEQHPAHKS